MTQTAKPQFRPDRFRTIRRQKQIKVPDLASLAAMTETQVYRLERGERPNLYAVTLARIALALGTSIEYLLDLTDDPSPIISEQ